MEGTATRKNIAWITCGLVLLSLFAVWNLEAIDQLGFGFVSCSKNSVVQTGKEVALDKNQNQNGPLRQVVEHDEDDIPRRTNLKLALLMSFPNSGTSYTLALVRSATNRSTASSYCSESQKYVSVFPSHGGAVGLEKEAESSSWNKSHRLGPHLIPSVKSHRMPESFILTKTHCEGYCDSCRPSNYAVDAATFRDGCLSACKLPSLSKADFVNADGWAEKTTYVYNQSLVGSVIHVFRDPFDNIISRFHLHKKSSVKNSKPDANKYNNTPRGFQDFCRDLDERYAVEEEELFGTEYRKAAMGVPCHADFYRYVQWHNLAFETTEELRVPSRVVYYEDYGEESFNSTLLGILDFLGQQRISEGMPYHRSDYSRYYESQQREAIVTFIKKFSSRRTWIALEERYGL